MISLSLRNVFRNKRRSFLTVLGVLIGVAAIVGLVSVSLGIGERANSALGSFQGLWVLEEGAIDVPFSIIDESAVDDIKRIPGVRVASPEIWAQPASMDLGRVSGITDRVPGGAAGALTSFTYVVGIDPAEMGDYEPGPYYTVVEGSKVNDGNLKGVVIGRTLADLFNLFVGSSVKINGQTYHVAGIFEADARLFEFFIVGHIDEVREFSDLDSGEINNLMVIPNSPGDFSRVKARISSRFEGVLSVLDMNDFSQQILGFLDSLTNALWGISAIAGIVGGIGVMNTMLMSVMERIKEFGVLKAVGWRDRDVMIMIILESLILSLVGGIIGILLGYALGYFVESATGIPVSITIELIMQAMLFAIMLGFVGSLYPAYRSSHMDPVEAVRY